MILFKGFLIPSGKLLKAHFVPKRTALYAFSIYFLFCLPCLLCFGLPSLCVPILLGFLGNLHLYMVCQPSQKHMSHLVTDSL